MSVSSLSTTYGSSAAQRLLASLLQQGSPAGQGLPGGNFQAGKSGGPPPGPPPGPPTGPPPVQPVSSSTMGSLLNVQESGSGRPSASDVAARLVQDADGDGDGSLSLSEIQTQLGSGSSDALSAAIGKLDTDGDGKLNAGELQTALETREAGQHRGPPPPSADDLARQLIGAIDGDQDGDLTLDEVTAALGDAESASSSVTSGFSKLDTNGDGKVSAAELSAAIQAFQSTYNRGHHHAESVPVVSA